MNKYKYIIEKVSERLDVLSDYSEVSYSELLDAQKYSLTAGGKHLRALILIKCSMLGNRSLDEVIDYACALEMVHTYSLIHDDLPEMDNDDMRRGMPTCHIKYGTAVALLAGDAMVTKAFNIIACDNHFESDIKIECIRILSEKCGEHGMLAGQAIDKKCEGQAISRELLNELHSRKTGDMFEAAVLIGCTLGNVPDALCKKLVEYIKYLGLVFQIKDDILDVVSSSDILGKPVDSDEKSVKSTYVSVYGLEKSEEILLDKTESAIKIAREIEDPFFIDLAEYFAKRIK